MKGYFGFPKTPALLDPYHQIVYPGYLLREELLHLCRDAVCVFYSPSRLASSPFAQKTDLATYNTAQTHKAWVLEFCPVGWGCRIHRLHLCTGVIHPCTGVISDPQRVSRGPVGWGCKIHRLHLCTGIVSHLQRVSWGPVGWGCRMHRLHPCTGIRLPQWVS